mgnify:CR=1 FL=1
MIKQELEQKGLLPFVQVLERLGVSLLFKLRLKLALIPHGVLLFAW